MSWEICKEQKNAQLTVPQDELLLSSSTTLGLGVLVCVCVCASVRAKWKLQVPVRFAVLLAAAKGHATAQTAAKYHQTVQTPNAVRLGTLQLLLLLLLLMGNWPPVLVALWSAVLLGISSKVTNFGLPACRRGRGERERGGGGEDEPLVFYLVLLIL